MKVRSLTELAEFLASELAWRKRELTTLKVWLDRSRRQHESAILVRAGICLLYAHWEGFVKSAAAGYLAYVATLGLKYRDLTPNFVALGLWSDISQAGLSNLPTKRTALTTRLTLGLSEPASINWEPRMDAGSNLNYGALNEILCAIGLDNKEYLMKKPIIDQKLLANRNAIAHGERQPEFALEDYFGLNDDIVQLVERFRTDIENAAATNGFRRH